MKRLLCLMCAFVLLASCTPAAPAQDQMNIVATTYPTYLAALAVTDGVQGVSVSRLDTGSVSCLHDYTLTVNDMKKLSRADVIVMNGAGLEDFMADALATTDALVIDCSEDIDLLPAAGHHDHEHQEDGEADHYDPHYWMDPNNAQTMVGNVRRGLWDLFPGEVAPDLSANTTLSFEQLHPLYEFGLKYLYPNSENAVPVPGLITFHDGFQYLAQTFHLPLLASIEEEAGSEASAKEIVDIAQLVKEFDIPVIFTEVNGSDATANAIARETGCAVAQLSMIMDGREPTEEDASPMAPYAELMLNNIHTLINGFAGQEVLSAP